MKIIDISKFNEIENYAKLFNSVDGIILRLGIRGYGKEGKLSLDSTFTQRIQKVIESGLPWGVYFFPQSLNSAESTEEGFFIVDTLNKYDTSNMSLGIWLDSEKAEPNGKGRADNLTKEERTAFLNDIIHIVKGYFSKCGIYASSSWFKDHLNMKNLNCPFWVAQYGKNTGDIPETVPNIPYEIWQYTSKGKVDGVNGFVDLNIMKESETEVKKDCKFFASLPTLKKGSRGKFVRIWQSIIGAKVDGIFGSETEKYTKSWQEVNDLTPDKIVGRKTWKKALE